MKMFLKELWHILLMVYPAQFFVCLFFDIDEVDRWSRWTEVGFHLGIGCGCLFVCTFVWVYKRIHHKK